MGQFFNQSLTLFIHNHLEGRMIFKQFIFRIEGAVNKLFSIVPKTDYRVEGAAAIDRAKILEEFRKDRERGLIMGPFKIDENPSQDPNVVKYYYMACLNKQRMYAQGFPINRGDYQIIDAFVCLGSRFGLNPLQVFVEICYCEYSQGNYWANVYYVADSVNPAVVVHVEEATLTLTDEEIRAHLDRDAEDHRQMLERWKKFEREDEEGEPSAEQNGVEAQENA